MEENDTALSLQKIVQGQNDGVVLSSSIKPNVFTNLTWNNIKRLEETLVGAGRGYASLKSPIDEGISQWKEFLLEAQGRNLQMEHILSQPLAHFPWAFTNLMVSFKN